MIWPSSPFSHHRGPRVEQGATWTSFPPSILRRFFHIGHHFAICYTFTHVCTVPNGFMSVWILHLWRSVNVWYFPVHCTVPPECKTDVLASMNFYLWIVTPYCVVDGCEGFGGTYCFHCLRWGRLIPPTRLQCVRTQKNAVWINTQTVRCQQTARKF
jgi:hypothetical protein